MSRARRVAVLGVLAGGVLALSCQLLVDVSYPQPDAADAGGEAGAADPCAHALAPTRPTPEQDDDTTTRNDYWFATESLIVPLEPDGGVKVGLDLDDACSCLADRRSGAPSCTTPGAAGGKVCDFDGGVDDAVATLAADYQALKANFDITNSIQRKIDTGVRTQLIFVGKYNGKANDSDVSVAIVGSGGLYDRKKCSDPGGVANVDAVNFGPSWDGCDRWSPLRNRVVGPYPNRVPVGDTPSWVKDRQIVVPLGTLALEFLGEAIQMRHATGVMTVLDDGASGLRLEGYIAGRVPFLQMVQIVGRTEVDEGPVRKPVCATGLWAPISAQLCGTADVMEDRSRDHFGESCDAVSMVFGFTARSARVSDHEVDNPERSVTCDASVSCAP
jgi:hypothetical protein